MNILGAQNCSKNSIPIRIILGPPSLLAIKPTFVETMPYTFKSPAVEDAVTEVYNYS